jgi:hypothetical protein
MVIVSSSAPLLLLTPILVQPTCSMHPQSLIQVGESSIIFADCCLAENPTEIEISSENAVNVRT